MMIESLFCHVEYSSNIADYVKLVKNFLVSGADNRAIFELLGIKQHCCCEDFVTMEHFTVGTDDLGRKLSCIIDCLKLVSREHFKIIGHLALVGELKERLLMCRLYHF